MVLSSSPSANTTPSDSSNAEEMLQSLYRAASASSLFTSPSNGESDTNLLMEDPPLSSSDIGGMVNPAMKATPTEASLVNKLRSAQ